MLAEQRGYSSNIYGGCTSLLRSPSNNAMAPLVDKFVVMFQTQFPSPLPLPSASSGPVGQQMQAVAKVIQDGFPAENATSATAASSTTVGTGANLAPVLMEVEPG